MKELEIQFNTRNPYEQTQFEQIYQFIKNNQFIYSYRNGIKYFFFAFNGRIGIVSERMLCFYGFTATFFLTVAIRKISHKYQLGKKAKKKLKNLFKKVKVKLKSTGVLSLRGGSNEAVIHYEKEVDIDNSQGSYYPILNFLTLNKQQLVVKGILKKCLKQDRYYEILNRGLLQIVDRMMGFKKKDSTKVISYDVFILVLWEYAKPLTGLVYEGTYLAVDKLGYSVIIRQLPFLISIVGAVICGSGVNVALRGTALRTILSYFLALPGWAVSYQVGDNIRNLLTIDCSDYLRELPVKETKSAAYGDPIEICESDNSKVSVTPAKPTRHQAFVSTTPDKSLHYEAGSQIEIETLDGRLKESRRVNGEKVIIWRDNEKFSKHLHIEVNPKHIPLEYRTGVLADTVDLDTTKDRTAAEQIRRAIQAEQIRMKIIEDSLE